MRGLEVDNNHQGTVFACRSVPEVHRDQYAWFEHVVDGLWTRVAVLLADGLTCANGRSGQQCSVSRAVSPQGFVVDVASTHVVLQMALRVCGGGGGEMPTSAFRI